jgi:hypothetical protein
MKRIIIILISSIFAISTYGQVNGTLSYQGYLTDDAGEPKNDGVHTFYLHFMMAPLRN